MLDEKKCRQKTSKELVCLPSKIIKATTSECECMPVSDNVKSNKHIHINDLLMCEKRHDKQQFLAIIDDDDSHSLP